MAAETLSPRKQPVQARSRALVEAILTAAARVLEQAGLEGFNTNRVAEAAGVSVGSLYQYFPGKTALLAALVRQDAAELRADLAKASETADGARATVEAMVDVVVAHQTRRPVLARLLDFAERDLDLESEDEYEVQGLIGGVLSRHATAFPGLNTSETARDLMVISRALADAGGDPATLRQRVLRAVWGYLATP